MVSNSRLVTAFSRADLHQEQRSPRSYQRSWVGGSKVYDRQLSRGASSLFHHFAERAGMEIQGQQSDSSGERPRLEPNYIKVAAKPGFSKSAKARPDFVTAE